MERQDTSLHHLFPCFYVFPSVNPARRATEIYKKNGYDIALVQRLLQHSSAAVTQRYIGIEPQRIEKAIEGHAELI